MTVPVNTCEFENGIRLIHLQNRSPVAHFGLMVLTGTREERIEEHGLAHLMEHMFFKGTRKRSAFQIISRLEDVGGELNAYTTKEETALYASFLAQDYRRAMELIQDIYLYSTFPEKELAKEVEVILNEIQGYDDSPSELIFDRAEEILYPEHPIGRNILGSEASLNGFTQGKLNHFMDDNYATGETVLTFVGNLPFATIRKAAERYFSPIPLKVRYRERVKPLPARAMKITEKKDTVQKHGMIIGEAYALTDPRRLQLYLLNNILGGPGMNSRLNMALRERRGYSYDAESHYAPYTDTGVLMVYFSSDPEKFQRSLQVCREEIGKLRNRPIPEIRLGYAKKQLLGQLAISRENTEHLMLTAGKSHLVFNRFDSLEDIAQQLDKISAIQLMDRAREVLDPGNLNLLIFE